MGNLTLLECLVGVVELREKEFAVAVVLETSGLGRRFAPALAAALPPVADGGEDCAAAG